MLQDIICSRNLLIFDGEEGIPWGHFAGALLTWLLFNTTSSSTPSVPFVISSEAMRRSHVGISDTRLSLPDTLSGMHSFPGSTTNPRDSVFTAYSTLKAIDPTNNVPTIDYSMTVNEVFCEAAFQLNDASSQPLSLSLVDGARLELPSWTPDWTQHTARFLLNHAASNFSASPYAMCEAIYRHRSTDRRQKDAPNAEVAYVCLMVDAIQHRSGSLPPRRHCDHYAVSGANNYFFSKWHDFAKEHSRGKRPADLVSLAYADTIQARGCGHVWEDMEKTPEERIQEMIDFLGFLESEDSAPIETDLIRLSYAACFPSHDRMFAITKGGRFCLVPRTAKDGDLVCIPHGSRVPYIFRQDKWGGSYQNIGEAFVHGLMHGEAGELEPQDIRTFHLR
ncbi:uncharacterized protein EKO05_0006185 [Ascochyta rabiei]|nr:uncharacterized protein EKO05_0006185 [Ascochyta rabiei]UPX15746.1 hypothetical protein EKO05_0006185 [Ascochyta rabiei]